MRRSGQMTVFLAMVILCICALMSGLLESARTAGTRWYFKMAAASSLDSVMSGFHRALWDRYHLLLLEAEDETVVEDAIFFYIKEYDRENHLYPMEPEGVTVSGLTHVTDSAGEPLEREIIDYMKFGFLNQEQDFEALAVELKNLKEADSLKEISGLYEDHAREAFLLEEALEEIADSLESQRALVREGEEQLDAWNGSGFIKTAKKLIKEMERMPKLIGNYEERADALGRRLDETEAVYAGKRDDLGSAAIQAMEAEIGRYREYTDEDGKRRQEIFAVGSQTEANIPAVQDAIDHAEEVMDYIASWEGDDEDDELDEGPLWDSVLRTFRRVKIGNLGVSHGIADKEKKSFLESVRELVKFDLMSFVLPEGRTVSPAVLSSPYPLPSEGQRGGALSVPELLQLPTRLAVAEYSGIHFNDFTKNKAVVPEYEMEYILNGDGTDEGNLEKTVEKLLLVREGMNLLHILTDSGKMQEAQALAASIVGITGLAPLVYVMTFFIACIWALGEALVDVRTLLAGGKVPLIKDAGSWKMSLENLLELGRSGAIPEGLGGGPGGEAEGAGLSYETYLKLLMMLNGAETVNNRILDLIQINIGVSQEDFQVKHLVYRVEGTARARGRYLDMRAELDKAY